MTKLRFALAAALLASAGIASAESYNDRVAATGEAKLAKALQGRVAGKPVDCINLRDIRNSQIYDNTAITYDVNGTLYVNRPRNGASSLNWDPILLTDTHSSQLCSIDTVRLIDRTSRFPRGFVLLGDFVPYKKVK
jgi:hypothetical protein